MMSPQAWLRLVPQVFLPFTKLPDNQSNDVPLTGDLYGAINVQPKIRKAYGLAEEGSLFTVNNAQTGIVPTFGAFVNTSPYIVLQNLNTAGSNKNLMLDYAGLIATVAGTFASAGVSANVAVVIDSVLRYTSGGTPLTPQNVNMNAPANASNIQVVCGAIVATAPSANARMLVGNRIIRPAASATQIGVIGDELFMNFGGVENAMSASVTLLNPSIIPQPMPCAEVGPGGSILIYVFFNGTTPAAAAWAPELGFFVR